MGSHRNVLSVIGLLVLAAPLHSDTTGQLRGRVVDTAGSPLAGVSVVAVSPAQIGGEQSATTDAQGVFLCPRLAPGIYTVRLGLDGFVTQELTDLQVRLDRLTEAHLTMPRAYLDESLVVSDLTPVVDPARVSAGQTFGSDYLENAALGVAVRWSYQRILTQAAGTVSTGVLQGAPAMSVYGSTATENVFLIDGLDTTNPYWGTARTMLPVDSIREINMETGGFTAEYGRATGGVINLVTKSGGNAPAGTFDARYSDSSLETSGRHYDTDEQPSRAWIAGATLGGPFAPDRAWYFAALERVSWEWTPTGSPTTFMGSDTRGFAKVTGRFNDSWLGVGKVHRNPLEWRNVYASQFRAAESTGRYRADESILQAATSGMLSKERLWEIQTGAQRIGEDYAPMSGDSALFPHFNLATNLASGNAFAQWIRDGSRDQLGSSLTWFAVGGLGSHEIELGAEIQATRLGLEGCDLGYLGGGGCRPGEHSFGFLDLVDATGAATPYRLTVTTAVAPFEVAGNLPSLYLQDAWRPRTDLSLRLGLRWDRATYGARAGDNVAGLEMFQPRLGAAWDVSGDGRNLIRASWGRFVHTSSLRLPSLTAPDRRPSEIWASCSSEGFLDPGLCQTVAASFGLPWRLDPAGWDPAGWVLIGVTGAAPTQVAPDLEPAYSDTLTVGFERALARRSSVELSYVKKATRDIFDDSCVGNYPVPKAGADCSSWIVFNIPQAKRDYEGWTLKLESHAIDRLHLLASYTNADSRGSIASGSITDPAFDLFPYHFDNYWFELEEEHRIKVNGYAMLPNRFSLAFAGLWSSEFPWYPHDDTVEGMLFGVASVESQSRKGADFMQLDLQLVKSFDLERVRLKLLATVVNALDSETVLGVCEDVDGCGDITLGEASTWQQPRSYELGLRLEFGRD